LLGAWGCGVFGNDPATVAEAFGNALKACPWFDEVVFAALDNRKTFAEVLIPVGPGDPARDA
jgi:uncharacterized protein (TIGR02452 family)